MNEPSPDHNPSDFSTPQGRARENRMPDGRWMIPCIIFGPLVLTGIVALILRCVI